MKRAMLLAFGCLALLGLSGCGTYFVAPVRPPAGGIFTRYQAPLSTDFDRTAVCERKGSAKTRYVMDPFLTGMSFAWEDAMIEEAAANGNIQTVEYADYEYFNILGIYSEFTVHAYGN